MAKVQATETVGLFLATTLAAIALTLLSRMLSIAMKMPSTVFIVTGIFVAARTPCHAARVSCHISKSAEYAKSRPFYATSGFLIYAVFYAVSGFGLSIISTFPSAR